MTVLEEGLDDATAVLVLPEKYRHRLATTNMVDRLNEKIRRRERVIRIFRNEASALRLIGTLLAEQHEEWSTSRRYSDMTLLEGMDDEEGGEPGEEVWPLQVSV